MSGGPEVREPGSRAGSGGCGGRRPSRRHTTGGSDRLPDPRTSGLPDSSVPSTTPPVVPLNPFTYIRPRHTARGALVLTGRLVVSGLNAAGEMGRLVVAVVRALIKQPQRREVIATQLYHIGYLSLPVVLVSGIAIGLDGRA